MTSERSAFSQYVEGLKQAEGLVYTPEKFQKPPGTTVHIEKGEGVYGYTLRKGVFSLKREALTKIPFGNYEIVPEPKYVPFPGPKGSSIQGPTFPHKVTKIRKIEGQGGDTRYQYFWIDPL